MKKGFTLIELLVVIAIIAILAAVLFPVITSAKEKGKQSQCVNNLKQLTMAVFAYCEDHDDGTPYAPATQMSVPLCLAGLVV